MKKSQTGKLEKSGIKLNLSKKIYFFTMGPFFILIVIMSAITIHNKINTEKKLMIERLNNYAALMESGVLSFESIAQKDKLEDSLEEIVLIAEIIKDDYSTPYSTDSLASMTSFDKEQVDKVFEEKNLVFFISNGGISDFLYPIAYSGSIVGVFHVRLQNINIRKKIFEYSILIIALNAIGFVGSFFLIKFLVNKTILVSISDLMIGSKEIMRGNLNYELDIKSEDEIGDLSRSFNKMTKDLRNTIFSRDSLIEEINERNVMLRNSEQQIRKANIDLERELAQRKQVEDELKEHREHLEEMVRERTTELEVANKELEAFAYSVSHDLRLPLHHIDGFLGLLQRRVGSDLDKKSRNYMDAISDSAIKMGQLIEDLLSFSRLRRHDMAFKPVELELLVDEVIDELKPETTDRNIHWTISSLPVISGDRAMLRAVLVNLISNAVKFTQTRAQAEIEIASLPGQNGEAVVFIRDNGVGFDMAYADKLFGVFQRLHRADEFEGTGIGLANVRRIIERHGGRVWAEAEPDQGATFYFALLKE